MSSAWPGTASKPVQNLSLFGRRLYGPRLRSSGAVATETLEFEFYSDMSSGEVRVGTAKGNC